MISLRSASPPRIKELSIVIPTLNEESFLPRVLDHLSNQKWDGKLQVIVADGESKDKTREVAMTYKDKIQDLTVVTSHNRTIGGARNVGAAKAKYGHILFIDCDVFLPPHFLSDFFKKLSADQEVLVFVLHIPSEFNLLDYIWTVCVFLFYSVYRFINPFCSGTFLFITKKTFLTINGFKEGLKMAEDVDLSQRAIKAGATFKFFYTPYVFASARRLHEIGRLRMLYYWMKGYFDSVRSSEGKNEAAAAYTFGTHRQDGQSSNSESIGK